MKNKNGFSPLEILVALTIGSMVSLVVMKAISQLSSTLSRTITLTQTDMTIVQGVSVLEQDFSSLCMPEYIHFQEKDSEKNPQEEAKKKSAPATQEKKKEYFKKAFCIKQSDRNLEECSCISMYTINKDYIAPKKIFYTLEEYTQDDGKVYRLYRQECDDLQAEKADEKKGRKFLVMSNIVSLTCTLWARHLPPEEKQSEKDAQAVPNKKEKKKERKKFEYKSFLDWDSDKNNKEKKDKEHLPLFPEFIDITLVMQQEKGREVEYSTTIMTPAGFPELVLIDIVPVFHEKAQKDKQSPQEQLKTVSDNADLSDPLGSKIKKLADGMNIGQKEK